MAETVIGIFGDHNHAEQAIRDLKQAGFRDDQVGFVVRHRGEEKTETSEGRGVVAGGIISGLLGAASALLLPIIGPTDASNVVTSGVPVAERAIDRIRGEREKESKAAVNGEPVTAADEEAEMAEEKRRREIDEGSDAVSGAVLGGFLGAAGALLIPGIGPVVAGGILITALAGAAIGATTGGVIGAFVSMGLPEHDAHHYAREFEAGRTIVTVKTDGRQQEAFDILRRDKAHEVQAH
jgi:hypothetical protein